MNVFLKLEGIQGESTDATHGGEIDILSYSWGASNSGASVAAPGAGRAAGRATFGDVVCVKQTDRASPQLFLRCVNGQQIPEAVLSVRKPGASAAFLEVTFTDVVISSYQTGGDSANDSPTEEIAFVFHKISFLYRVQLLDGSFGDEVRSGWDVRTNSPA